MRIHEVMLQFRNGGVSYVKAYFSTRHPVLSWQLQQTQPGNVLLTGPLPLNLLLSWVGRVVVWIISLLH